VPFALDTLPDGLENEPNNTPKDAEQVTLPVVMNGTIGTSDDRDCFSFKGRAGDRVALEVMARRLDSPLDSLLKVFDDQGVCIASNDDSDDIEAGVNTHPADSYLLIALPRNGTYTVCVSDTQHKGGEAYGYRLRMSAPRPDFALRIVPSRVVLRGKGGSAPITVYAVRKDGFTGTIRLAVEDPSSGFTLQGATLSGTQTVAKATIQTTLEETDGPLALTIQGCATNGTQRLVHTAVPAEDRMQAFLWRHLVPAQEFLALVFDPKTTPNPHPKKGKRFAKKNAEKK
jgi:hypothetical protein